MVGRFLYPCFGRVSLVFRYTNIPFPWSDCLSTLKILFISPNQQQGSSGVADYAMLLSRSLRNMGADVYVESLPDPRSSSGLSLPAHVSEIMPDWVSFQFAPYAYAYQGMVDSHTLPWERLRGRIGTHIMFHELWIGANLGASLRNRLVGFLQRRGIRSMLHCLTPDLVHCSNPLYSSMLGQAGIQNRILPLFGNVPVVSAAMSDPYAEVVASFDPGCDRKTWLVAAFFGTIYPSNNLFSVLEWLQTKVLQLGKRLLVVSLGHSASAAACFSSLAEGLVSPGRPYFFIKGRLEAGELSRWIRFVDCGLSTTPFNIIDKSGTALAFAEHGVPVIVMDEGSPVRGLSFSCVDRAPDFWLFGDARLDQFCPFPPRRDPHSRLEYVSRQFLTDLARHGRSY